MVFSLAYTDKIQIQTQTGVDGAGKPEYGDPVTYNARVQQQTDEIVTVDGQNRVSSHTIYLREQIPMNCRIFLPHEDPATSAGHRPLAISFSKGIAVNVQLTKVQV